MSELYSDIDLAFRAHPITGDLVRRTNREAVKQAVRLLVLTNFYERPFRSNIGSGMSYLLFELFSPSVKQQMESAIRETIKNYEPRADVIEVLVEERPDLGSLTASIAFFIKNDTNPIVFDLILERIR